MKKIIIQEIRSHLVFLVFFILVMIGYVFLGLLPPQLLRVAIDSYTTSTGKSLSLFIALYVGAVVLVDLLEFAKNYLLIIMGERVIFRLKQEMLFKCDRLPLSYFVEHSTGEITSRFSNDIYTISSLFTDGILSMMIDLCKMIGIVISMFLFSITLGLFTLTFLPILYVITRIFQKKMYGSQKKNRVLVGEVSNQISETLENRLMMKETHSTTYFEHRYSSVLAENYKTKNKVNFFDSFYSPVVTILRAIVISILVLLACPGLSFISISLGSLAGAIELLSDLFKPVDSLGMELQGIQKARSGLQRVEEFLRLEERKTREESQNDNGLNVLHMKNVSFSYEKNHLVLDHISITFLPGQMTSLGGRTGVGKSTLMKLIMGLYDPDDGTITLGGKKVSSFPKEYNANVFGYVGQDMEMVEGTIKDQITLYQEMSDEKVICCLEKVGLWDKIKAYSHGLYEKIDNVTFSEGEKQLFSIARLFLDQPRVVLLDEISSHLDTTTEEHIYHTIQELFPASCVISISHRLQSMLYAQKCVYLEHGKVIFDGNKEELENLDWFRQSLLQDNFRKEIDE